MESKDLKITAADYVMESKMTNPAKLQMLNFIQKEANDHQLMSLMLDGKIVKLDEQAKQIVEDRFYTSDKLQEALTSSKKAKDEAILKAKIATKQSKMNQAQVAKSKAKVAGK